MRVLLVSPDADNGGQGIGLKRAFDRYSDIEVRSVTVDDNYLKYEPDWVWGKDEEEIRAWEPDLYHFRRNPMECVQMFGFFPRHFVVHHHGTEFRDNIPRALGWAERHKAKVLVATLDLHVPGTTWLPAPHDVEALAKMAEPVPGRIVHAPTNRHVKNSFDFFAASKGLDVDLIERRTHAECLGRKAKAQLLYDQLTYGYGLNGIEAMCMGIPVLGGCEVEVADRMRAHIGYLPFWRTSAAQLHDDLRTLLGSSELRLRCRDRGRRYVNEFHSQQAVVERLTKVWESCF